MRAHKSSQDPSHNQSQSGKNQLKDNEIKDHNLDDNEQDDSVIYLLNAGEDILTLIVSYLDTKEWIQFSYCCSEIYVLKEKEEVMIKKQYTFNGSISYDSTMKKNFKNVKIVNGDDDSLAYFQGVKIVDITNSKEITNSAFIHLKGIESLDMMNCNKITDSAFVHLKGIKKLYK